MRVFFRIEVLAQRLKHLPTMRDTWVRSLGWEDPLKVNGNQLQYSCLENPMDRGAWWATIHGVAKSDKTEQLHFHFHFLQTDIQNVLIPYIERAILSSLNCLCTFVKNQFPVLEWIYLDSLSYSSYSNIYLSLY